MLPNNQEMVADSALFPRVSGFRASLAGACLLRRRCEPNKGGGEFVGFGEEYWWERLNQCGRFAPWQRLDFNGLRELAPDAIKI